MLSARFDYPLPDERIAQEPIEPRDAARLMRVPTDGPVEHFVFSQLPELLEPGDLLVMNDTRVLPARLRGRKPTGGEVELLLLERLAGGEWTALVRPNRRLQPGAEVTLGAGELRALIGERGPGGARRVGFTAPGGGDAADLLQRLGELPLPPYFHGWLEDPERYQTVYSRAAGSAAAPTAGLHFTPALLDRLARRGVGLEHVTLHVGLATFRPIRSEHIEEHQMHSERYEVPDQTVAAIRECPGRVVVVGTTTVRCLEAAARRALGLDDGEPPPAAPRRRVASGPGETRLFLKPGSRFLVPDLLITNFHQPRSSLLVLVSAFAGLERIRSAYEAALDGDYRFLSFGDAMLLTRQPGH